MVQTLLTDKLVKRDPLTRKLTLTPTAQKALNELESEQNKSEAMPLPFPPFSGAKTA